jgi:DNA topoisomerase IA
MREGSTVAPPLLTEADLISLMEKHGIGRNFFFFSVKPELFV